MKLFWKDHVPLLAFYTVQMTLVPLLYWLAGEKRPISIILYGVLLSSSVLTVYLVYRYLSHRNLYKRLHKPLSQMEDILLPMGETPFAESISSLLNDYNRYVQKELHHYHNRMKQHTVFINRWVHQMKTPLSVLQLSLNQLEDNVADSMVEELERLKKGLEMVIYTSRLEHFEHDLMVETVLLREIVNKTIAENRKLFIRKGIVPHIYLGHDRVYSDSKWLQFIVGQILTNAVNYTDGIGRSVYICSYTRGKSTVLEFRDEGIGITKEDLKRVFHPYFTGEQGRQYNESTGMGLYLVQEICNRLGHHVELESKLGEGTIVRLVFDSSEHNLK